MTGNLESWSLQLLNDTKMSPHLRILFFLSLSHLQAMVQSGQLEIAAHIYH